MDSRRCEFMPPDAAPQTCCSALPPGAYSISTLHHKPLDKTKSEIRVLCPYTPAGSSIDKLEFTIRTVSLNDKPKYWALSYVWGDQKETAPICIQGQTFMATLNLHEALKRVRNIMTSETMDLQLWVDAICINQTDTTEKSWQVDMMSRIYSQAYCVNVWLGLAEHNTKVAMEFVAKIGSSKFTEEYPLTDEHFVAICEDSISSCKKEEKIEDLELITAVEDIFNHRQYWKRAWTLQEFCLNSSIIWCGDSFFSLGTAINFIVRSEDLGRRIQTAGTVLGNMTPIVANLISCNVDACLLFVEALKSGSFPRLEEYKNLNEEEKLALLLCRTTSRQASEPKDKIYSLLGLCNVNITPDYSNSLSAGVLFQDTATLILGRVRDRELLTGMLGFAGLANHSHQRFLPSWAVEWDTFSKAPVNFKATGMAANKHFTEGAPQLKISNLKIAIQAVIIDEVKEVCITACKHFHQTEGAELFRFFFDNPPMAILPFIIQQQPRYRTGVSLLTAVLSTLMLGRDVVSKNDYDRLFVDKSPCANFGRIARIFLRLLLKQRHFTGTFFLSLESYLKLELRNSSWNESELGTMGHDKTIDKTINKIFGFEKGTLSHEDVLRACSSIIPPVDTLNFHNKTPFSTHANRMAVFKSKEGYIGAARAGVAPHDVICVLRDTNIPSILRRVGENFVLVSPCYVEGLMDGQAWEMVQAGEKSIREIIIV